MRLAPTRRQALAGLGAAVTAICARSRAFAQERPALGYAILWRDGEIGRHRVVFAADGSDLTVDVGIEVTVTVFGRQVYAMRHRSRELWRSGALVGFEGRTDDNGTVKTVRAAPVGDVLRIEGTEGSVDGPLDLLPASYWHPRMIARGLWLNGVDGTIDRSTVDRVGDERMQTAQGEVQARHYRLQGDLDAEIWYAGALWSGLRLAGPAGTVIDYRLDTDAAGQDRVRSIVDPLA
ncbi:DUF6134 family protein [Marinivivus vitaminiproducens]|uniref:DUF6134 family protein n=1 Tax=Marinivivus vitaminiproducens TaxID=3035935 RepID=UPI0027AA473C|nr:DUF6134 family protein [Geminicoccaceae bacterium SCSIO 64248]